MTSGNLTAISATMTSKSGRIRSRHPPVARSIGILADKEAPMASEGTHESDSYASATTFPNRKLNFRTLVMAGTRKATVPSRVHSVTFRISSWPSGEGHWQRCRRGIIATTPSAPRVIGQMSIDEIAGVLPWRIRVERRAETLRDSSGSTVLGRGSHFGVGLYSTPKRQRDPSSGPACADVGPPKRGTPLAIG